jgi:hypothetical protein
MNWYEEFLEKSHLSTRHRMRDRKIEICNTESLEFYDKDRFESLGFYRDNRNKLPEMN